MVQRLSRGGMLPSYYFETAIYQFAIDAEYRQSSHESTREFSPLASNEAASNALLAATISLLLVLFVTLSCIDDKQVAPSNDMSLDRSPMYLGGRRMGVQVDN